MPTRYRWYRVQLPKPDLDLARVFARNPFTQEAMSGFSRIEGDFGIPAYRYFWRTKTVVVRLDDDGDPLSEEIASVSFTDFTMVAVDGLMFLRVENPGRNIRDLLNSLESLVGLGFTCKLVTFEKGRPTTLFEKAESSKLVGLRVVGAVVEGDMVARMDFVSKLGMNINDIKILRKMQYKIDSTSFELVFQGVRGQVVFSSGGLVKISGQLAPLLVSLVEQDLPALM